MPYSGSISMLTRICLPVQAYISLDPVQHDYLLALLGSAASSSSRPGSNGHPQHPPSTSGSQLGPMRPFLRALAMLRLMPRAGKLK